MTDDDYARCLRVLTSVHAAHNWRHYSTRQGITRDEWCVQVIARTTLSTFDMDGLTRLVIAAHREHCRASVSPHGFGWLLIQVHPRQPEGDLYSRHPGIERLREPS